MRFRCLIRNALTSADVHAPAGPVSVVVRVFPRGASSRDKVPYKHVPLRGEVHKLRGELVCRKLGRRLFHHLLQLLKGRSPRVVREAQDGELDLRPQERRGFNTDRKRRKQLSGQAARVQRTTR